MITESLTGVHAMGNTKQNSHQTDHDAADEWIGLMGEAIDEARQERDRRVAQRGEATAVPAPTN